jgi:hypothetical protein
MNSFYIYKNLCFIFKKTFVQINVLDRKNKESIDQNQLATLTLTCLIITMVTSLVA